jgi:putative ubiquitin-RnfH superfamily antitoxin RatB of RatAB toxin-antitoxin module
VSVVYCAQTAAWTRELEVGEGTTLRTAIEESGVLAAHPELRAAELSVGVFSKLLPLDTPVEEGDRIEIYRPLVVDPKEARRHRAELRRRHKQRTTGR